MASQALFGSWLGIVLAIVGNTILAIGFVNQKRAHARKQLSLSSGDLSFECSASASADSAAKLKQSLYFLRSREWWLGLGLVALGEVLNGLALAFASGSIVPALGALALVIIAVLSAVLLGERPGVVNWLGIVLASIGVVFIAIWAPMGRFSESALGVSEAEALVVRTPFVVLSSVYAATGLVLVVIVTSYPRAAKKHVIVFSMLAALAGSFKQRGIKLGLQMFSDYLMNGSLRMWMSAVFWLVVLVAVVSTLLSLYFLNLAISTFPRQSLPVFFSLFVLLSVFSSNALYDEYRDSSFVIAGFATGMASVTLGCVLYSFPFRRAQSEEAGRAKSEEAPARNTSAA